MKKITIRFLLLLFLLLIFIVGMITQRYYGLGNILKKIDPTYVSGDKKEVIKNIS